jgi:hypothetical protein
MGKFAPHATLQNKARKEVWGGREAHATGIAEEEDGRNSGETESPEQWRRKKNLRSGLPLSWK